MSDPHVGAAATDPHILAAGESVEEVIDDRMIGDEMPLTEELRRAAGQMIDEQKSKAADAAQGIANALRQAGEQLSETPVALVGRYAIQTAENVEHLSDRVRDEPLADLLADAEDAARRQPELFFLGAAAAGFLIGRFLKASADRRRAEPLER